MSSTFYQQRHAPSARELAFYICHSPLKRIFDIVFSLTVLIFLSPLFLAIALTVKLTSKGPILFSQTRIGRGGKSFHCLKFRTMFSDSEKRLTDLLNSNPTVKQEWTETRKIKNDPRITPFGRLLRKTSLDELPQFINAIKGDLSVVGPRPVVYDELINFYGSVATKLLSVRPGITGLWQVSGRSDTSYKARVELDEKYIDTRTLWLDIKLIVKTIPCILFSKGAY